MMKLLRSASVARRLCDVLAFLEADLLQREMLVEKFSGGVVVLDREVRAGDAVIVRGLLDQRQCRSDAGLAEIADADLDRFRRARMRSGETDADHTDPPADHGSSLNIRVALTANGGAGLASGARQAALWFAT